MELETLKVCIEGVDCSGKTTLWNKIHKKTRYRWKLEDRSFITMFVYAQFRGDPKALDYERQLYSDLSNLNVKYVVINPEWNLIEARYMTRGDDVYNLNALKKIHELYSRVYDKISKFPNVYVLNGTEDSDDAAESINSWLIKQDQTDIEGVVDIIQRRAAASQTGEVSPLRFTLIESGSFPEDESRILNYEWVREHFPSVKEATVKEFNEMHENFLCTIKKELRGENIYNKPQTLNSRRFVFTQDACVSFIQAMFRDNCLKFFVTCRSSHVYDVFPADIRLMYHMCKEAHSALSLSPETKVVFEFTLNSAHVSA